ncbi:HD domain-containing protein [Micromonospora sp. WMMA1949]|uniref:HD domain-containing protein n=1 Tax=Micromonospora sp. WMMA1949 TaxID=3015162 RepID=UPI0022B65894|nr:HD domain-containing protein [Micromonospora sp. WMMA1949]MCZ7425882.1 HD domain-containing protein [Micromonospora sp. WMMA1949]
MLARSTAQLHLAEALPRRWTHVQGVAAKAHSLARLVGEDRHLLVAAAFLHDIGYSPEIRETGFHALDGARWLRRNGFEPRLAGLVAYHSCATYEAAERGLIDALSSEFSREESATSDALWFADMTTGPDGQDLTPQQRLAEIRERYGPEDLVTRFWAKAEAPLLEAIQRTEKRLAA